jgi:flavin reductase (DIM6/NTAB) family NADH-FMN oxidoreductase RutF
MSLPELRTAPVTSYRHMIETASDHVSNATSMPSVDGAAFKSALSRLAAGTNIVTMRGQDGEKLGLTATAVTSVSLDPPLVLVCINNGARTAAALEAHAPFIVHFLAADQEQLARHFASRIPDKFEGIPHSITESGSPRLEGALASIECAPYQIYPGGDHIIVLGRVVDVQVSDADASPLIYFRNRFLNQ